MNLIICNYRSTSHLVPGEYSNGTGTAKANNDDDDNPYGDDMDGTPDVKPDTEAGDAGETGEAKEEGEEMDDEEEGETEEDEDDDGLDIVVAAPQRSMDFR